MSRSIRLVLLVWMFVCSLLSDASVPTADTDQFVCEYYNYVGCLKSVDADNEPTQCNGTEICSAPEPGKRSHCYVLWVNGTVHLKGCFLDRDECYDLKVCTGAPIDSPGKAFCCCEGRMCNVNALLPVQNNTPLPRESRTSLPMWSVVSTRSTTIATLLISFVPLVGISIIIIILYIVGVLIWRRRAARLYLQRLPTSEPAPTSSLLHEAHDQNQMAIEKLELKAQGRFGSIWKARISATGAIVAVKIFPLQDRESWLTEQNFYTQIRTDFSQTHPNILRYIAADKRTFPGPLLHTELWLITEYHELGSLYDYLKGSTVTLLEFLRIAITFYRGLGYLHSCLPPIAGLSEKPAIAHRDIKSRNIVLKRDMTACIADFGLALVLRSGGPGDVHNQVGTRRYMAPEVLDGSINFSIDSFLKIDIYASALVLWELLSRCSSANKDPVGPYRMPFETEVGSQPSLEVMQEKVVRERARPRLDPQWLGSKVFSTLCSTLEECWDQDPEARLTAECIEARLSLVLSQQTTSSTTSSIFVSASHLLFETKDSAPITVPSAFMAASVPVDRAFV